VHLLSVAFLFAQFGMVVHASTHLRQDPHASTPASQLCGECLSFAPLQSMVGGAPVVVLAVNVPHERVANSDAVSIAARRPFSAFRSRAPPQLS
jgi:hypothetical protein